MLELETLPLLRRSLDPIEAGAPGTPPDLARRAEVIREENLRDMAAAAHLRSVEPAVERGDHRAIAAALDAALRAHPRNLEARRLMGEAQLVLGDRDAAEHHLREALAISSRDPAANASLGLLCLTQGRLPEAIEHYRLAIAGEPNDPELWNNLGAALGQDGDLEDAARHFQRAVELNPAHADARRNLERTRAAMSGRPAPPR
jgi:Flp pilus assembly protein TadD